MARGAVDGALETQVAKAAVTAFGNRDDLTRLQQLEQDLTGLAVREHGAHRHLQGDVCACGTKHVGTHSVLSPARLMAAGESVIHQGVQAGVGYRENMAAAPTITAVGTAKFLVLFMAE